MLKKSFTKFFTISKLLNKVINEDKADNRYSDKRKHLLNFSTLQKSTRVDYLILGTKKTLNLL